MEKFKLLIAQVSGRDKDAVNIAVGSGMDTLSKLVTSSIVNGNLLRYSESGCLAALPSDSLPAYLGFLRSQKVINLAPGCFAKLEDVIELLHRSREA